MQSSLGKGRVPDPRTDASRFVSGGWRIPVREMLIVVLIFIEALSRSVTGCPIIDLLMDLSGHLVPQRLERAEHNGLRNTLIEFVRE